MAADNNKTHGQTACTVEVSPSVVDAGSSLTLKGTASCTPPSDLRGKTLLIKDQDGALAGSIEFTAYDGEVNETSELVMNAPVKAGAHMWLAVCPAHVTEGITYIETSALVSFTVKPHTSRIVVWDVPSAIVAGDRFNIKVGIKCSNQCQLTNREFGVFNHEGTQVATGTLGDDPWQGTTALYFAEVELAAPDTVGLHKWEAKVAESDLEVPGSDVALPHGEGSASFGVRFVVPPEHLVTVEAIDKVKQTPLRGARVVMHPYGAVTDERGVAEVRVPQGNYKIFVSRTKYLSVGMAVEVTGDMAAKVELSLEPVPERN